MQQAISGTDESMPSTDGQPPAGSLPSNGFVINLCASTTPVALTPPNHAGLRRFTFFVSRRREDNRERFRLHMGYFDTQEEAEKLLEIVREIYPGAWAGLAPGQRLRSGAAPDAAAVPPVAAARPVAAPATAAAAPHAAGAPHVAAAQSLAAPYEFTLIPEPAAADAASFSLVADAASAQPAAAPDVVDDEAALSLVADTGRRLPDPDRVLTDKDGAGRALTAVRTAIASLDDSAPRRRPAAKPATKPATPELSERQVLKVLESGTSAAAAPEKPYFAVQLMWSVKPIDIAKVPQLAIFTAYTVYAAEGSRDGRRWYGLRLGFFTDAVSAKQVAHYVRSEFSTVSVVPVTMREREHANLAAARPAASVPARSKPNAPAKPKPTKFLTEEKKPVEAAPVTPPAAAPAGGSERVARAAQGKRAKQRAATETRVRTRTKRMTLEETLEILGAGELQIDTSHTVVNDTGVRHLKLEGVKAKPSRLTKLFERLSQRLGS